MKTCREPIYKQQDVTIRQLGAPKVKSPLAFGRFVDEEDAVLVNISRKSAFKPKGRQKPPEQIYFEMAGPREKVYFDPSKAKCAIVTCGGLCPGLNDVIRAIVMTAHHQYNVPSVLGIQFGLAGFIPDEGYDVVELKPENVNQIHEFGGTMLGSSRGPQPVDQIVDALERMNISIVFLIGGDGTMRAAEKILAEVSKRNLSISIVGLPKTIDNDINFASPSFGFDTAVDKATEPFGARTWRPPVRRGA